MKTVVLGFDGLSVPMLDRFSADLPRFETLRERGVEVPLESTVPLREESVWPSLFTGADPSHHGVYGARDLRSYPDEGEPVSRIDVRRPALWDYLSREGSPVIVLNVPLTHPADPIRGVLVPGPPAREDEPGHPPEIRSELSSNLEGGYRIRRDASVDGRDAPTPLELMAQRRRAFVSLLENREWELAVCRLRGTDATRYGWRNETRIRSVFEAADRFLGEVLDAVDERTNVVVCSAYGTGPVTGYRIHVNELLRERGFLETRTGDGSPDRRGGSGGSTGGPEESTDRGRLERTLEIGRQVATGLGFDVGSGRVRLPSPNRADRFRPETVDWRRSLAYCPDGARDGVRVNLIDREPDGVVSPFSYETIQDELVDVLSAVETPDGDPAFEFVCRRDHLFDGPFVEDAPDVLFLPAGANHALSAELSGRPFVPTDGYGRRLEGAFLGAGPGFSGADADVPSRLAVPDVAPIVMTLLSRPVPSLMTGDVPAGFTVDPPARADYGVEPYGAAATDPSFDDGRLADRLGDLEYR